MARFLKCDLEFGSVCSPRLVMPVRAFTAPPRFHESTETKRDFIN